MNCPPLRDLRDGTCPVTGKPRSGLLSRYRHLNLIVDLSTDRDSWIMGVLLGMDRRNVWDRVRVR